MFQPRGGGKVQSASSVILVSNFLLSGKCEVGDVLADVRVSSTVKVASCCHLSACSSLAAENARSASSAMLLLHPQLSRNCVVCDVRHKKFVNCEGRDLLSANSMFQPRGREYTERELCYAGGWLAAKLKVREV